MEPLNASQLEIESSGGIGDGSLIEVRFEFEIIVHLVIFKWRGDGHEWVSERVMALVNDQQQCILFATQL